MGNDLIVQGLLFLQFFEKDGGANSVGKADPKQGRCNDSSRESKKARRHETKKVALDYVRSTRDLAGKMRRTAEGERSSRNPENREPQNV